MNKPKIFLALTALLMGCSSGVKGLSCPNEKTPLTVEVKGVGVGGAAVQID